MTILLERATVVERCQIDTAFRQDVYDLCRFDPVFFIDYFGYTYNPRKKPNHFEFLLYPFQVQIVRQLKWAIENGEPGLIKKSRDMGLTWLVIAVFYWFWLFHEGSDFYMTSKIQDDVDKKGDKSTLFEKVRYLNNRLPAWMRPPMGRGDDAFCKFVNPLNGNSITGGAPTMDLGRSQRYLAALLDEMARLPYGQASYDSISQSTDCIIMVYTPYGKNNAAYRMSRLDDLDNVELSLELSPEEMEKALMLVA